MITLALVLVATLDVTDVSLFKNGLGYFIAETSDTSMEPPPAVHGTIWAWADRDIVLEAAVDTTWRHAQTFEELLRHNIGRNVELRLEHEEGGLISWSGRIRGVGGELVTIDDRTLLLRNIREVAGSEIDTRAPEPAPRLTITPQGPTRLSWLQKGITWAPSYLLDISDSPGRLKLQGTIFNEARDLENARVSFISGFPNLAFSDVLSPLSMKNNLWSFLNSLGGGSYPARGPMAQVMMNAPMSRMEMAADQSIPTTTQVEDLFYYTLPNVTVKNGARAAYEILSEPVSYLHIYTWGVRGAPIYRPYEYRNESNEEIWHLLRFKNSTEQPLTTAPVLMLSEGRIVGQDMLAYTPRAAAAEVKITKAVDLEAEAAEIETDRQPGARRFHGTQYDLVTVEGTLSIRSFKDESVLIEITKELDGNVIEAGNATIEKIADSLRSVNPRTRIKWTITVPAGKEIELRYRYKVYVQ